MENRIIELEARLAHQERTLDEVNEVLTSQQAAIETLQKRVEALADYFRDGMDPSDPAP
jgi:uncharacterized coiled-coil protein SlyX